MVVMLVVVCYFGECKDASVMGRMWWWYWGRRGGGSDSGSSGGGGLFNRNSVVR